MSDWTMREVNDLDVGFAIESEAGPICDVYRGTHGLLHARQILALPDLITAAEMAQDCLANHRENETAMNCVFVALRAALAKSRSA